MVRALAIILSATVSVSERSMRRGSAGTRTVAKAASGNAAALTSPRTILLAKRRRDRGIHGRTTRAPTRQPARLTASADCGDERAGQGVPANWETTV